MLTDSRAVVRFYNKRGTAEQWIQEGKQAVKMRLSCHRFRSNEVWLSVLAYNLGSLWRRLVLPKRIDNWSRWAFLGSLEARDEKMPQWRRSGCIMIENWVPKSKSVNKMQGG